MPVDHAKPRKETPEDHSGRVAETPYRVDPEMLERRRDIRKLFHAATWVAVGIAAYSSPVEVGDGLEEVGHGRIAGLGPHVCRCGHQSSCCLAALS